MTARRSAFASRRRPCLWRDIIAPIRTTRSPGMLLYYPAHPFGFRGCSQLEPKTAYRSGNCPTSTGKEGLRGLERTFEWMNSK